MQKNNFTWIFLIVFILIVIVFNNNGIGMY